MSVQSTGSIDTSLSVGFYAVDVFTGNSVSGVTINNAGDMLGYFSGIMIRDSLTNSLTNTASGSIGGADDGIGLNNSRVIALTNSGSVTGGASGIYVNNVSTLNTLTNDGTITGTGLTGLYIYDGSTVGAVDNSGTISGDDRAIDVRVGSTLTDLTNSGTLSSTTFDAVLIRSDSTIAALTNEAGGIITAGRVGVQVEQTSTLTSLINQGGITGSEHGVVVLSGSEITTLTNSGSITGTAFEGLILNNQSAIGTFNNGVDGSISGGRDGIRMDLDSSITTFNNQGEIAGNNHGVVILLGSEITAFTNSGAITGTTYEGLFVNNQSTIGTLDNQVGGSIVGGRDGIRVNSDATVTTFTNRGDITGSSDGLVLLAGADITTITNSGTISGSTSDGIYLIDQSAITTLTNEAAGTISSVGSDGISLQDSSVLTGLSNSGNITGDTSGVYLENLSLIDTLVNNGGISGNSDGIVLTTTSTINQITNSGDITGTASEGVVLSGQSVIGDLTNQVTGSIAGGTDGISVSTSSTITALDNDGAISGAQEAVYLAGQSSIDTLTNGGTITGGIVSNGIELNDSTIAALNNESGGAIEGGLNGIYLNTDAEVTVLTNAGDITASILDAVALDGQSTMTTLSNEAGGSIAGDEAGIALYANSVVTTLNNAGGISGGTDAIYAEGSSTIETLTNTADGTISSTTGRAVRLSMSEITALNNSGAITASADDAIQLENQGSIDTLTNNGSVTGDTDAIVLLSSASLGTLTNNSTITATTFDGVRLSESSITSLSNTAAGSISGGRNGVALFADSIMTELSNAGLISGAARGISVDGQSTLSTLTNAASGTLAGDTNAIHLLGSSVITGLTNIGSITATNQDGIVLEGLSAITTLENTVGASISAGADGIALYSGSSVDQLINAGSIEGASHGVYLENLSEIATLTNDGGITGTSSAGIAVSDSTVTALTNTSGSSITGGNDGVSLDTGATLSTLHNELDGVITGGARGVSLSTGSVITTLNNDGTIASAGDGVFLEGASSISILTNTSFNSIDGDINGVHLTAGSEITTLTNTGRIEGGEIGVKVDAAYLETLTNYGTIRGGNAAIDGDRIGTINNYSLLDGAVNGVVGVLNLEGNQARITGPVSLSDGLAPATVNINGSFTTENTFATNLFNINSGGLLNLNHDVAVSSAPDAGFTNKGTLAIAAGSNPTITGDYTQTANAVFRTHVANDTTYGQLTVLGTATLPSNARIDVDVSDPAFSFTARTLEDVIAANALISDGTFNVTANSMLFTYSAIRDGNTVDLVLTRAPDYSLVEIVEPVYPSAVGGAEVLDDSVADFIANGTTGDADMDSVVDAFGRLGNERAVADAVAQTVPLLTGGSKIALGNTLNQINHVIQRHGVAAQGRSSGDAALADRDFWLRPFASRGDQDDRNSVYGYNADSYGLILGLDLAATPSDRIGVALGYANSDIDGSRGLHHADVDSYQLGLYGRHTLAAGAELSYQADYGRHTTDGKRQIRFMDREAKSDYDSTSLHLGAALAKTLRISDATQITPSVRVDYTRIDDDGYTEKGAGALNLTVNDSRSEELLLSVAAELDHPLSDNTRFTANVGVSYDAINEQASLNSALAGAPGAVFKTEGLDPPPWSANIGVGVVSRVDETLELAARYDLSARKDFDNQTLSATLRWRF